MILLLVISTIINIIALVIIIFKEKQIIQFVK